MYGPQIPVCDELHANKYRLPNENFEESVNRNSAAMSDDDNHRAEIKDIFLNQRFLPAGRVQSAMGVQEMLQHIIVLYLERLKTVWNLLWNELHKQPKPCVEAGVLVMTLALYGLVVIVSSVLIVLLVAPFLLCISMMQYVGQLFQRDTDGEQ